MFKSVKMQMAAAVVFAAISVVICSVTLSLPVAADVGPGADSSPIDSRISPSAPAVSLPALPSGSDVWLHADDEAVIATCTKRLAVDPQCLDAYVIRAKALSWLFKDKEALDDANIGLKLSPNNLPLLRTRADCWERLKEPKKALADLNTVLQTAPDDALAFEARAKIKSLINDDIGSLRDQRFALLFMHDSESLLKFGASQIDLKHDDLTRYLQTALLTDPIRSAEFTERGDARYMLNDAIGAAKDYTRALKVDFKNVVARHRRELVSAKLFMDNSQSKLFYAQLLKINNLDADLHLARARAAGEFNLEALQMTVDYKDAISSYNAYIQLRPQDSLGYLERGGLFERAGNLQLAFKDYSQVIVLSPSSADGFASRGFVRFQQKDYRGALIDLNKSLALNQNGKENWSIYLNRAKVKASLNDEKGALTDFLAAAKNNQEIYNQGLVDFSVGQMNGSMLNPQSAEDFKHRGDAFEILLNHQAAIRNYSSAISKQIDFPAAYYNRGTAYEHKSLFNWRDALKDYAKACELDPGNEKFWKARLTCDEEGRDFRSVVADCTRVLKLQEQKLKNESAVSQEKPKMRDALELIMEPEAPSASTQHNNNLRDKAISMIQLYTMKRGLANFRIHNYRDSVTDLDKVTQPDLTSKFMSFRACAKFMLGDFNGAIVASEQCQQSDPDANFIRMLAECMDGRNKDALRDLQNESTKSPEFVDAFECLKILIHCRMGDRLEHKDLRLSSPTGDSFLVAMLVLYKLGGPQSIQLPMQKYLSFGMKDLQHPMPHALLLKKIGNVSKSINDLVPAFPGDTDFMTLKAIQYALRGYLRQLSNDSPVDVKDDFDKSGLVMADALEPAGVVLNAVLDDTIKTMPDQRKADTKKLFTTIVSRFKPTESMTIGAAYKKSEK